MDELPLKEEVYAVIGAAIEVHRELRSGYSEAVYQEALEIELASRCIPFVAQCELQIQYKGRFLNNHYCADFVCFGQLIVEIKALDKLTEREESQLLNYLKVTGFRVDLLINFGAQGKLEWKRFIR